MEIIDSLRGQLSGLYTISAGALVEFLSTLLILVVLWLHVVISGSNIGTSIGFTLLLINYRHLVFMNRALDWYWPAAIITAGIIEECVCCIYCTTDPHEYM
jgi:hypothetical protein